MAELFTSDDITVLIEALDAWINKDASGEMLGEIMVALIYKGEGDQQQMKRDRQEQRNVQAAEKMLRKERAILIQAKLIQMRDRNIATSLVNSGGDA